MIEKYSYGEYVIVYNGQIYNTKELKETLLKNDFSELKSHNRLMYKYCHTLLENKLDKFYFQTKYLYRFVIKEEI